MNRTGHDTQIAGVECFGLQSDNNDGTDLIVWADRLEDQWKLEAARQRQLAKRYHYQHRFVRALNDLEI